MLLMADKHKRNILIGSIFFSSIIQLCFKAEIWIKQLEANIVDSIICFMMSLLMSFFNKEFFLEKIDINDKPKDVS